MRRLLFLLSSLLMLAQAVAAQNVKVVFPDERPRRLWMADAATLPPVEPVLTMRKEVSLPGSAALVCVVDLVTGNLASREVPKGGSWKVEPTEFNLIAEVKVWADGASGSEYRLGQTVGRMVGDDVRYAEFYGVPPGEQTITFGKHSKTVRLSLTRSEPVPLVIIRPSATSPTSPTKERSNILGNVVSILLVTALALGILVFGLKWIYSNTDKAQAALGKIGVQVPDPSDPAPTPDPPLSSAPAPITPIVLNAPPNAISAPAFASPRLQGSAGSFELTEGVHVIGRDATCTVPLVGESSVSRRHAEIVVQGGQMTLRDLGSTNGTFLNGQALSRDSTLKTGDTVRFGSVEFSIR